MDRRDEQQAELPGRFTILGPPGLTRGHTRLDLGTPQQQAVLLALLRGSGSYVRMGELIDGLWGEHAPASGEAVIRTYISRIRRLLSAHGLGCAIRSRSGGYRLDPGRFEVDATEFTRLVEAARQERAGGNLPAAVKLLTAARELWTGTALAGVPGDAAERERARLERLNLAAVQELLRLRLELGEHAEVVAEVPTLLQLNRLEEPLYEIYLLALYRGGRRAEALEVYRTVHQLLDQELGVSPGPGLRAIHEQILRADRAQPAPRMPPPAKPAAAGWFVGRQAELAAFREMLTRGSGVLFISGPVGIGKSTLLRRFAEEAAGRPVCRLPGPTTPELPARLPAGAVLLIDSGPDHHDLEQWLPNESVVVVASRTGPSVTWLTEPAWSGRITLRHLDTLTAEESAALLETRGVKAGLRESIMDFAAGHPLALSLAAEIARSMTETGQPSRPDAERYVVDQILDHLTGDFPTPHHRLALHVCAHARPATEDLLRVVVPGADPGELFDWLRAQPYVEAAERGLEINGVLRTALDAHLRWRDPVGHERLRRRIHRYRPGTVNA